MFPFHFFLGLTLNTEQFQFLNFIWCKRLHVIKGTPSTLDYQDVITTTSSVTHLKTTAVLSTCFVHQTFLSHEISTESVEGGEYFLWPNQHPVKKQWHCLWSSREVGLATLPGPMPLNHSWDLKYCSSNGLSVFPLGISSSSSGVSWLSVTLTFLSSLTKSGSIFLLTSQSVSLPPIQLGPAWPLLPLSCQPRQFGQDSLTFLAPSHLTRPQTPATPSGSGFRPLL